MKIASAANTPNRITAGRSNTWRSEAKLPISTAVACGTPATGVAMGEVICLGLHRSTLLREEPPRPPLDEQDQGDEYQDLPEHRARERLQDLVNDAK